MKRIACVLGLVVILAGARTQGASAPDALSLLRAALGGEAALAAVQTIRARGTIDVKPYDDHFDIAAELPDRFVNTVHTFRRADASWSTAGSYTPGVWQARHEPSLVGGGENTSRQVTGFDRQSVLPLPRWFDLKKNAVGVALLLDQAHARFAEFVLPLMGRTPSSYPVHATSDGNVITFRAAGDRAWRLELDEATHLPRRMSWVSPVRVHTDYSDFRIVGGVRWPHRLMTWVDGKLAEDATVERYDLNVKLSDRMFRK